MRNRTWSVVVLCAWWVLVVLVGAGCAAGGTSAVATTETVPPDVDPLDTGQVDRLDERHGARVGS